MKPRVPNIDLQEEFCLSHTLIADVAATALFNLGTLRKIARIDRVEFVSPSEVTGHASNYYVLDLTAGAVKVAEWSFDSDVVGEGTAAADTVIAMGLEDDANLVVPAGTVLKINATKAAAAVNLPAGLRINIFGRYI